MRAKSLFIAIAASLFLVACHSDSDVPEPVICPVESTLYVFPTGWENLSSHAEKVAALQIPDDTLKTISTENLAYACINYPLSAECFDLKLPKDGFEEVTSEFNGFAELRTRSDAFKSVLKLYKQLLDEIDQYGKTEGYKIDAWQLAFYEFFIAIEYSGTDNTVPEEVLSKALGLQEKYGQFYIDFKRKQSLFDIVEAYGSEELIKQAYLYCMLH